MDIFGGNPQLEAAVFTGIDMALFTRHTVTVMENPTDYLEDFIRAETPFEPAEPNQL